MYGVRLGGPIKKDKIFLFGNYEGERLLEGLPVSQTVPTASFTAGNLSYTNSGGGTTILTPAQFASMDPNCSANGTCPMGPGVDSASLAVFKQYPLPNGATSGDGLNTASYSFSSAAKTILNDYITRLDYNLSDKYRFYIRASMQNDTNGGPSAYPGQEPAYKDTDNSKGVSGNFTWSINNSLVNNARYGYIRQSIAATGSAVGSYTTFRGLSTPDGQLVSGGTLYRNNASVVPTHNVIDDLTWTKGRHTIQFGGNYRAFSYQNSTDENSYNSAITNVFWLLNSGFAGTSTATNPMATFDPGPFGFPTVDPNSITNYNFAVAALAGLTDEESDHLNYTLSKDGTTGSILGVGVPVKRNFKTNEFEYYVQDSFKMMPNLTITAGLRHTILQTPYETNGQQVQTHHQHPRLVQHPRSPGSTRQQCSAGNLFRSLWAGTRQETLLPDELG